VKEDGCALQYVREQTEAICIEAIKQNEQALRFVIEQTDAICIEAVKRDKQSIQFINISLFENDLTT
jgi:hypothetical protein